MNPQHIPVSLKSLALAATLFAASTTASASLVTFTDAAAFAAAAGAVRTENFNRFTSDLGSTPSAPSFNFGDFLVKSGRWLIDAPNSQNTIDGTTNLLLTFPNFGNPFSEFNFAAPVFAFGFWYAGRRSDLGPDQASRFNVAADALNGPGSYIDLGNVTLGNGSTPRFIGVTAAQAFNRITFSGLLCCTTSYSMDNVMYTPVGAVPEPGGTVPEPGSLALVVSALGWLAWGGRRRVLRHPV